MIKIKINKTKKLTEEEQVQQKKVLVRNLIEHLKKYKDCICVSYDLETTGLNPSIHQITQIAGRVFEFKISDTPSEEINLKETDIEDFSVRVRLTDETLRLMNEPFIKRNENEKSIKQVLDYTQYDISKSDSYEEEKKLINDFFTYINKLSKNNRKVVLIGHNIAKFDNNFIKERGKLYNLTPPDTDVLDTLVFFNNVYYPLLRANNSIHILDKIKKLDGSHTFALGKIADALKIPNNNWHVAIEDVKMLMLVVGEVLKEINANLDLDVTNAQSDIAKEKAARDKERKEKANKLKINNPLTENKKIVIKILRNT